MTTSHQVTLPAAVAVSVKCRVVQVTGTACWLTIAVARTVNRKQATDHMTGVAH